MALAGEYRLACVGARVGLVVARAGVVVDVVGFSKIGFDPHDC